MRTVAAGLLVFLAFILATPAGRAEGRCKSTVNGDLRLHSLDSRIFGNTRTVRVLLPEGYDAPSNQDRRYPVLYMLDGQNLFDACLSDVSHREWEADETVYRLARQGRIPPIIVVGVDHAGKGRAHEYLPYTDFVDQPEAPEPAGRSLPGFLTDEVMPLVDGLYRTLRGHPNTGLGGSSYGGAAVLYALMARPGHFGYGLIESPALHVGMGQLVRDTRPLVALPRRVFIGFGGREVPLPEHNARLLGLVRRVEANFREAGYDDSGIRVVVEPEAGHNEDAWAARLPGALEFLFGDWQPPAGD